jgi:4-amino-4-deoxy-L-arabinose transferase-like glycosyltransferase
VTNHSYRNRNKLIDKISKSALIAILVFITCRGATLELFDFSEPTEARYAAIGADMIHLNDWVVPQFPKGLEHEPYLGKPPLFFWLVAGFQKLFNFHETSARLPSFISGILTALIIFWIGSVCSKNIALSAILIWFGTAFVYFFSGAVLLDTVLTLFISLSLTSFFFLYRGKKFGNLTFRQTFILQTLFWIGNALGFLTKGPVALIFVGLPIFSFLALKKELRHLLIPITFSGIAIFLFITAPWFYFAEIRNPGFLEYFFYHENFLRYFVKNYGDKYGTGHRYIYGSALWMLFLGLLPWSLYLGRIFPNRKLILREIKRSDELLYFTTWACSIPLFLCFMKQLHPGYLIPAFPGIALSIAFLRETDSSNKAIQWDLLVRRILRVLILLFTLSLIGYSIFKGIHWGKASIFAILILLITKTILIKRESNWYTFSQTKRLSDLTILIISAFFCMSLILSREISENTSPSTILKCIAASQKSSEQIEVTFIGNRSYTVHYLNEAWFSELSKKLKYNLVNEPPIGEARLSDNIVVKTKNIKYFEDLGYTKIAHIKAYAWLVKNNLAESTVNKCTN